jgi:hypothetical protein
VKWLPKPDLSLPKSPSALFDDTELLEILTFDWIQHDNLVALRRAVPGRTDEWPGKNSAYDGRVPSQSGLDSFVTMVQPANLWNLHDPAQRWRLNGPADRGILAQR